MSTFTGGAVNAYAALTIAQALKLYAQTGMKVNRAYTPKAMMQMATKVTGQKFAARDYLGAADALRTFALAQRDDIAATPH
jgi:hypothetical protein